MKLIVGLGNPGVEYENTRHNIGYMVLDSIVSYKMKSFDRVKFNAKFLEFNYKDEKVIFVKPLSYMNLSGDVVSKFVNYYKISLNDILVIQDDLDMPLGKIKIIYDKNSGGHNGIKDIENKLGSKKFARLKIGIANDKSVDTKDYVLGKFSISELKILDDVLKKLVFFTDDFCDLSLDRLMNKYNNK